MLKVLEQSSDPVLARKLLDRVKELAARYKERTGNEPSFMEVCGSHTMALARTGIKALLQGHVNLISGPGCPVCVTDQKDIDAMIELADGPDRILCTFGDMMRVPGSKWSLMEAKAAGADVRPVYSPNDALKIAASNPDKEVIFLGIGFETTIPVLAAALDAAERQQLKNFSMWVTTKLVEPVLRALLESKEVRLDGFILPGHVSIVLGRKSYRYLDEEYGMPGVICGFEPVQVLAGIYRLLELVLEGRAEIINEYTGVVTEEGNIRAQQLMEKYLEPVDEAWRGIGIIPKSGLDLRPEYDHLNAKKRFSVKIGEPRKTKCRCGEIIRGVATPPECPLFGKACTPAHPIGPCMVSSEGSCAAHYHYMVEAGDEVN